MKKYGFTLAEVLITLVIIGIIAALTIPNLMQKYTEQTTVKKVQKFYSNLSNAYKLAMKDSGPVNEWGVIGWDKDSAIKVYDILFKPYFKITKDCGTDNKGTCIANVVYKQINNSNNTHYASNTAYYKIVLEDGAAVWWRLISSSQISVDYDVNGTKEPNQWGKDSFIFVVKDDKVYPAGIPLNTVEFSPFSVYCKTTTGWGTGGWGCAAWVVYKGNMDYLHCDGLTWNSRSCKEK